MRRAALSVSAASQTSFVDGVEYNARGQRLKIAYSNGTVTVYTYDAMSFRLTRMLTTRTSDAAIVQDLRYFYDAVGNVVELRDYATQSLFFADAVAPPLVSPDSLYEYDPVYRLTAAEGREHPSHTAAQVDENDSPESSLPHPNDLTALKRYREEYDYDGVGNILAVRHRDGATLQWSRLYQYATASNRLLATSDAGDVPASPYTDTPSYTDRYTYDPRGSMTSMPHLAALDWDYGDRLAHADRTGGGNSYFTYDAAGTRVRKVWVKSASLIEERLYVDGYEVWRKRLGGALDEERQTLHVMDDARRVAMVETKTVNAGTAVPSPTSRARYQLDDLLGSSRVELDEVAALLTYEEYHPYGTTAFRSSSGATGFAPKRYRYTGKERDEETGLYYYGARYYPPWLARWTACDPSLRDGFNRYEYVRGNPITFSDPDGRQVAPVPAPTPPPAPVSAEEEKAHAAAVKAWQAEGDALRADVNKRLESAAPEERAKIQSEFMARWEAYKAAAPGLRGPIKIDLRTEEQKNPPKPLINTKAAVAAAVVTIVIAGVAYKVARMGPGGVPSPGEIKAEAETTAEVIVGAGEGAAAAEGAAPAAAEAAPVAAEAAPLAAEAAPAATGEAGPTVSTLNSSQLLFSQSSVSGAKPIAESMAKSGWQGAPIDVVDVGGRLVTLDNTRLLAAHMTGTPVQAIIRRAGDALPPEMAGRFVSKGGAEALTWGEAVMIRIANQNAAYRRLFPMGSWAVGVSD